MFPKCRGSKNSHNVESNQVFPASCSLSFQLRFVSSPFSCCRLVSVSFRSITVCQIRLHYNFVILRSIPLFFRSAPFISVPFPFPLHFWFILLPFNFRLFTLHFVCCVPVPFPIPLQFRSVLLCSVLFPLRFSFVSVVFRSYSTSIPFRTVHDTVRSVTEPLPSRFSFSFCFRSVTSCFLFRFRSVSFLSCFRSISILLKFDFVPLQPVAFLFPFPFHFASFRSVSFPLRFSAFLFGSVPFCFFYVFFLFSFRFSFYSFVR